MINNWTAGGTRDSLPLRWGFVGTGAIATKMASVVSTMPGARLCAVASRHMATARSFAAEHGAQYAFDSWAQMFASDAIDAVYVATPTGLREAIAIAAAAAGKHVLAEKPFVSLASLKRITAACRENGVGFMDATHFVHHPRYAAIMRDAAQMVGRPRSLDSRFLIGLTDRHNVRYDPALEPLGAIGDLGWYSMRASLEYLAPGIVLSSATTRLQRDAATKAIIAAQGSLNFDDDSVSHWQCRFDATSVDIGLTLTGSRGVVRMDNFIGEDEDRSASYSYACGNDSSSGERAVRIASRQSGPALMFEDLGKAASDASLREHWMQASERTQALLDAAVAAAKT